ncbi:MAG TPA: CRISPR-associated endonuclease Cas1 [Candidatus Hydrogenedentes bacterium]|nr:CRISPR-associated endonuclease Cas1 [Candidatus Hydrogenedentota bacterium]
MLNEYAYCPRLFHLMHVDGRWADNVYTVEGRNVHRRADRLDHVLPDPEPSSQEDSTASLDGEGQAAAEGGDERPTITRSVALDSVRLGLTAKLDLVSTAEAVAVPVETKRGRVPNNEQRSYEPERVQLMAQGLLLREQGYRCDHGVLYFAGSRTRVDVPFTPELEQRTLELIQLARAACSAATLPVPLDDSPKCNGCSLAGICLPDETGLLRRQRESITPTDTDKATVRRFFPVRDNALPLYVQEQGATVCKTSKALVIWKQKKKLATARVADTSQLVLCGNVSVTAQTIHLLCEEGVPIVHLSMGHWFYGLTQGLGLRNAFLRASQFRVADDAPKCLELARQIVTAKVSGQRTLLRRNASDLSQRALDDLAEQMQHAALATSIETLLGVEGAAAKVYFANFSRMIKSDALPTEWDFQNRNRRPPRDPINALLSFGYAMLAKECTIALLAEGFDPYWGFYHRPRHGRPGLALDLMEEFRTLVVDSAVLTSLNTGMVGQNGFEMTKAGCAMRPAARKAFIRAYEGRLDQLVTHPVFEYRCCWRTIIRLQAKLLARWVRGEIDTYPGMVTR